MPRGKGFGKKKKEEGKRVVKVGRVARKIFSALGRKVILSGFSQMRPRAARGAFL